MSINTTPVKKKRRLNTVSSHDAERKIQRSDNENKTHNFLLSRSPKKGRNLAPLFEKEIDLSDAEVLDEIMRLLNIK